MVAFKRILCPVDLSPYSRGALSYALAIARWYHGRVTALHVAPASLPPLSALADTVSSFFEPHADLRETVEKFVRPLASAGAPVAIELRQGDAASVILEVEKELSPDLVTIGSHGLSALERVLIGSVADKVLRESAHPVLAVRAPVVPQEPFDAVPFESVLVALDFSHPSMRALEYAYALAQEANARVVLLHVVEETRSEKASDEAEREARRRLHEVLPADAQLWCEPEIVVTHGPVDEAVGRIASEWGSELVVLGALGRAASGAHLDGILQRVRCPVLVTPAARPVPLERRPSPFFDLVRM